MREDTNQKNWDLKGKGKATTPDYLARLADRFGVQEAGKMLGLSHQRISECVKDGETRIAYELAAKAVWNDKFPAAGDSKAGAAVVSADKETLTIIESMVLRCGGKYMEIDL